MEVKLTGENIQKGMNFSNCEGENAPCIYPDDDDILKSVSDQYNKAGPTEKNNGSQFLDDLELDSASNLGTLMRGLWNQPVYVSAKGKGALKNVTLSYDYIGMLYFRRFYKSGYCEIIPFTPYLDGPMRFRNVKVVAVEKMRFFAIHFVRSNKYVFGDLEKRKKHHLYEAFKRANVAFNETLSEDEIGTVLYNSILEKMDKPNRTLRIEYYPGWNEGTYVDKGTFQWKNESLFCDFPVNKKLLARMKTTEESIKSFIEGMQSIPDFNIRLFSLIYPVASILASIFSEEGLQLNVSLNFITDSEFSATIICNYFQILNREKLRPVSGEATKTEFKEIMGNYKDESLIFDCRNFLGNSQNQNNKNNGSLYSAHAVFAGKMFVNNLDLQPFGLVTISEKFCSGRGVINLYADNESFGAAFIDNQIISEIFFEFVDFTERSLEKIRKIILSNKQKNKEYDVLFCSVREILTEFWHGLGYDFNESFLLPEKIDFSEIINSTSIEDEEILTLFVASFRKLSFDYEICDKRHPWTDKPLVRDAKSEKCIAVPPSVLDEILKKSGLFNRKLEILRKMKQVGNLVTDAAPWTKRISIDNRTRKFYFIKKDFLNATGKSDIVLCFEEVE